jgi:hypothetical protein
MSSGRRSLAIVGGGVMVWALCTMFLWALRPLNDTMPVGIDYTLEDPAQVSVKVHCNTLFDGPARDSSPLPTLKAQPTGVPVRPPLAYPRTPCGQVHRNAQIVFTLDALLVVAVIGFGGWLALRWRRPTSASASSPVSTDLVGLRRFTDS